MSLVVNTIRLLIKTRACILLVVVVSKNFTERTNGPGFYLKKQYVAIHTKKLSDRQSYKLPRKPGLPRAG